jgi:hypothetical protein
VVNLIGYGKLKSRSRRIAMFRKFSLCTILCLLMAAALAADSGYPILLGMGALMLLAIYAPAAARKRPK